MRLQRRRQGASGSFGSGLRRRNPLAAAFWSLLAPGLGLIYCRQIDRAGWYMLAWIAGAGAAITPLVFHFPAAAILSLLAVGAWAIGLIDSVIAATRAKAVRLAGYNRVPLYVFVSACAIGYMFGLAPELTPARLEYVKSNGMTPNLMPGETVLMDRRAMRSAPMAGTVVLAAKLSEPDGSLIGRVIAGPGERVAIRAGRLFLNGREMRRVPLLDSSNDGEETLPRGNARRFRETLPNGRSYEILESLGDDGPADNTPEWRVPKGHVFLLGDNRDVALDSRRQAVGFVSLDRVRGALIYILGSDRPGRLGASLD